MSRISHVVRAALFCLGFGCANAWWPVLAADTSAALASGLPAGGVSVVIGAAFIVVTLCCAIFYRQLEPRLSSRMALPVLGIVSAAFIVAFVLIAYVPGASITSGIVAALAGAGAAASFIAWLLVFDRMWKGEASKRWILLAAMVTGALASAGCLMLPASFATGAAICLPLVSGLCAAAIPQDATVSDSIDVTFPPKDEHVPSARTSAPTFVLPVGFLLGTFVFELAPGFVSGYAFNGAAPGTTIDVYLAYLALMALIGVLGYATRRLQTSVLSGLVTPLLAVGLLAVAAAPTHNQVLAAACVLVGSTLFEFYVVLTCLDTAHSHGKSPLCILGIGCTAIQVSLFVSYLMGTFAAFTSPSWLVYALLAIAFLLIAAATLTRGAPGVVVVGETAFSASQNVSTLEQPIDELGASTATVFLSEAPSTQQGLDSVERFSKTYDLSARETEVLRMLARGQGIQRVADNLNVSYSTAKTYVGRIYTKTGVNKRQELLDLLEESAS